MSLMFPPGPDPDFRVLGGGGGGQPGEGSRGRLGPLWVQGKAMVGDSDRKQFSVF